MTAIANIAVPDAATTPVTKTYEPNRIVEDTATWLEKSPASPQGYPSLDVTLKDPASGGKVYTVRIDYKMPTLVSYTDASGRTVTEVDYSHQFTGTFRLPSAGVLQNRKDFRKLLVGILNHAQLTAVLEDLSHPL